MFGPFRSCMYPSTFRSTNVRKATASRMGTMKERGQRMWVISAVVIVRERS